MILYRESWINTIIPNNYLLLCLLKNHSIIFNKIPDQIPKGYVQAKTFNGENKDKDTHTKLQYGLQAKCKSQVLVLQFIQFHNLFSRVRSTPQDPQLLLIPVQGGDLRPHTGSRCLQTTVLGF